ncbi:NADH:ubiquinone oxidoreductase 21kD subunit, partial [Ascosphaera atra]
IKEQKEAGEQKEIALAVKTKQNSHLPGYPGDLDHNAPDYYATVDHGTSTFSPVPKRVLDGSEGGSLPAAVLSGAPVDLQARTVRIYKPAKPATQSGDWHAHKWRMDWDILQKGHRWENPLMGWQSSADEMQGTNLNFNTKEDAIRFAEKQGYEYFVQEPQVKELKPKSYAANFLYSPKKLKVIRTK